jgi:hypothetical protein
MCGKFDADKFIGETFAKFGIADDLLQFFVQKLDLRRPVNFPRCIGKEHGHKLRKKEFNRVFPRCVEVVVADNGLFIGVHGAR